MKTVRVPSRVSARNRLLDLLIVEFRHPSQAIDLFEDFLRHETYERDFVLRLIAFIKRRFGAHWELKRAALLMLENQLLKLDPADLREYEFVFDRLNLKQINGARTKSVIRRLLNEGYSTTDLQPFVEQFRRRLERLNRIHQRIKGRRTSATSLREFIRLARRDCKLSLARYLLTPKDAVEEILGQLEITGGVRDVVTPADPGGFDTTPAVGSLPDFESAILKSLCESSDVYWVSDATSSEINSLVEYPLTTVVVVVKPPGSEVEFEIKRAGRRGPQPLSVVYERGGYTVPPSHRLDGGSMQGLLRYEASAA